MKELEKIVDKYFQKDGSGIVYGNINQKIFNKVIDPKNIGMYERPDILSIFDDKIIGIEHFEFDSFKRNRKGSDFKVKENQVKKKLKEKAHELLKYEDSVMLSDQIKSSSSLDNYYKNFEKVFLEHYNKIDSYIEHIKSDFNCRGKKIYICFFAEDVSPLGSYFLDKKRDINLLYPLYSSKIINLLEKSEKLEYLIIGSYALKEYKLTIVENTREVLEKFKKNKVEESDFLSFEPRVTSYTQIIPNNIISGSNKKIRT